MTIRPLSTSIPTLALLVVAACGGGKGESAPPASPMGAPSASSSAVVAAPVAAPGPGQWEAWNRDQKLAYMKSDVMPKMGAAFQAFDANRYANAKCNLCHASGAKDGSFKMPDPALPKLPANPDDFKKLAAKDPKVFEFMAKTVVPTTAALLGEQPFNPATHTGFGCYNCHTKG